MYMEQDLLLLDKRTQGELYNYLPDDYKISDLAALFAVFSEPTRLKILSVLSITELCVTDISRVLDINQTTISHQLHGLAKIGFVRAKRQGKIKFYSIANSVVAKILINGVEYLGY